MKMSVLKMLDIFLLIAWVVVGMYCLFTEVTKFGYACLLVCFIVAMIFKLLKDDYDDNDNNDKPLAA